MEPRSFIFPQLAPSLLFNLHSVSKLYTIVSIGSCGSPEGEIYLLSIFFYSISSGDRKRANQLISMTFLNLKRLIKIQKNYVPCTALPQAIAGRSWHQNKGEPPRRASGRWMLRRPGEGEDDWRHSLGGSAKRSSACNTTKNLCIISYRTITYTKYELCLNTRGDDLM